MSLNRANNLRSVLQRLRTSLLYALAFSIFVNLMLLGPTLYLLQVFDRVLTSRSEATLGMLSIGVAIALLAMMVVDMARARLLVETALRIDDQLGPVLLKHVMRLSSAPRRTDQSGSLRDVATLRTFCSGANIIALFDAPWMLVYVFVIFLFHPAMGALALCGALLLMALAWTSERTNRAAIVHYGEASRQGARFIEAGLRNADVINGMGMTAAYAGRWDTLNRYTLELMQESSGRASSLTAASKFLRQAIQVAMMGLGAWLVLDSHVTPGIMIAGTILFGRAMAPVEALIGNWSALVNVRAAWQRLNKALPEALAEGPATPLPAPAGQLSLEGVNLAGSQHDEWILRQVSLDLPAGKSLGLIGPSGAGKSSLARLMLGIWTPTAGKVRIDGAELAHWNLDILGANLGYLPQDVELLPGTVAENIARFLDGRGEDVIEAARRAHAYEMILKLPQGFETRLGEGGIQLSAGQAQRVGLARALFGKPKLIVLDEPNANLDAEGEQALIETLAQLKEEGTTLVMITHKPSLVASLDYLLVLREGRMELIGPREEVLARLASISASVPATR